MKCDICNENEAVISLRQVTSDKKISEIHLCMDCATKRGCVATEIDGNFDAPQKFNPEQVKLIFDKISKELTEKKNRACPVCGLKYVDIVKEHKVGCAECYQIFRKEVHAELKRIGVDGEYTGTCANYIQDFESVLIDRSLLQKKLEEAVACEDYEQAAFLRDKLKILENKAISGEEE